MIQAIETPILSLGRLLDFFGNRALEKEFTSPTYLKAVAAFRAYVNMAGATSSRLTETLLIDWFANMYLRDFSFKTSLHYYNIVSGLYSAAVKEGLAPKTDIFRRTKARLARLDQVDDTPIDKTAFERFKNVMRNAVNQNSELAPTADLILMSLLDGCRPLTDVARLKREDIEGLDRERRVIAERNANPRRQYIFDLRQSTLTPRQLQNEIDNAVGRLLFSKNIGRLDSIAETLASYWAYAAMQCGLSGSTIVGFLGHAPKGIPALALCDPVELSDERRQRITRLVGDLFVTNPLRWYALRLRRRNGFKEFTDRFGDLRQQTDLFIPEVFYPLDEVAKKVGKKIIFEEQPVLPDVVFINSRMTALLPLLYKVNDLAWCYTVTGRPGSPYAAISEAAFRKFQHAIGHFADSYAGLLAETQPVSDAKVGDPIKVSTGLFKGLETTISSIEDEDGRAIFRLLYATPNGIRWNISLRKRDALVPSPATL